jgi:LAS superfamily LD-carboxypeptidase LdcB
VRVLVVLCVLAQVGHAEIVVDDTSGEPQVWKVVGYRNGKAINLEVTEVDGVLVEVSTARAFIKMRDAADEQGVYLQAWSGFRSNDKQRELYDAWKAGAGNPAAKPGYSNHQSGRAIDINLLGVPKETYAWLNKNAARYGFRRTVPSEPWHWEYSPQRRAVIRGAPRTFEPTNERR